MAVREPNAVASRAGERGRRHRLGAGSRRRSRLRHAGKVLAMLAGDCVQRVAMCAVVACSMFPTLVGPLHAEVDPEESELAGYSRIIYVVDDVADGDGS